MKSSNPHQAKFNEIDFLIAKLARLLKAYQRYQSEVTSFDQFKDEYFQIMMPDESLVLSLDNWLESNRNNHSKGSNSFANALFDFDNNITPHYEDCPDEVWEYAEASYASLDI